MEYAFLFALMGTWIVFLHYRNYKLARAFTITTMMLEKVINEEVDIKRSPDGLKITVKTGE